MNPTKITFIITTMLINLSNPIAAFQVIADVPSTAWKSPSQMSKSQVDHLNDAFEAMKSGGVAIVPTNVGYTLMAIGEQGVEKMMKTKGRPDGKPCGIMGIPQVYREIFRMSPPAALDTAISSCKAGDFCMAWMGVPKQPKESLQAMVNPNSIGPKGEVGVWLNLGPVVDYLAKRAYNELGEFIVGTSCNKAGEGNPTGKEFNLGAVNPELRSLVDTEINIPHWSSPEFDEHGCWLSAPIYDMDNKDFRRVGKYMDLALEVAKETPEPACKKQAARLRPKTRLLRRLVRSFVSRTKRVHNTSLPRLEREIVV